MKNSTSNENKSTNIPFRVNVADSAPVWTLEIPPASPTLLTTFGGLKRIFLDRALVFTIPLYI